MKNKESKIDLFIVEGTSDEYYINPIKKAVAATTDLIKVKITYGDITALIYQNHRSTFLNKLRNVVEMFLQETSLVITDIRQIIHLVDTDAVSCNEECIIFDESTIKIKYSNDKIETNDVNKVIKRNANKKIILSMMYSISEGISFPKYKDIVIPYKMYYLSQNADHVFVNRLNLTDDEKEDYSIEIADVYSNDFSGYESLINDLIFKNADYKDSWKKILNPENAFSRKTNLNILIKEYKDEKKIK